MEMRCNDTQRAAQTHGQLAETHKDGAHTHRNAAQGHKNGGQRSGAKTENDVQRKRAIEHKPQTPRKHREWTTMLRHCANTENGPGRWTTQPQRWKEKGIKSLSAQGLPPLPTIAG